MARVRILVACQPKSGSTYTAKVLAEYFKAERLYPLVYGGYAEQNIYPANFENKDSFVTQLHLRPHQPNIDLIKWFDIQVVFQWRNIADSLVALDDHIRNEDHRTPACYIHDKDKYLEMDPEMRYDYLIRHAVPWYIAFYLSWQKHTIDAVADFEILAQNQFHFFAQIIDKLGYKVDSERLHILVETKFENVRFNKGIPGRSIDLFSEQNKYDLEYMLLDHPEDLSALVDELPWR